MLESRKGIADVAKAKSSKRGRMERHDNSTFIARGSECLIADALRKRLNSKVLRDYAGSKLRHMIESKIAGDTPNLGVMGNITLCASVWTELVKYIIPKPQPLRLDEVTPSRFTTQPIGCLVRSFDVDDV